MPAQLSRPAESEYKPAYAAYVTKVPDGDVIQHLAAQLDRTTALLATVSPEKEQYRYGPDKWTVTEVIGHVADAERVFAHRILRFGRNDPTELPGFDENSWGQNAAYGRRRLADVAAEFRAVREATLALLRGLEGDAFARSGIANKTPVTVRALTYIIAGHELHHLQILTERYGVGR